MDYHRKVDAVMLRMGAQVRDTVSSAATARSLWQIGLARLGTSTKIKVASESNIIVDGEVAGAVSTKCGFQFIVKENVPYVFKFPISTAASIRMEVTKDADIYRTLSQGPDHGNANLVAYTK